MEKIRLLDCTLRDGGYINDWNFGARTIRNLLARLVDGIAGGQVEPNPYVRGNRDACRFCAYASACHLDLWGEPRVYRAVSAAEFWEQVEKEGKDHG